MTIGEMSRESDRCGFARAAVVHVQGCNLRCVYCAYAGLRKLGDEAGRMDWKAALAWIQKRTEHLDGVVFSGGEPTLHEDLAAWMQSVRESGLGVGLETNGTRPNVLRRLLDANLLDFIAMDVKAPLANYSTVAGCRCDVDAIRASIWAIKQSVLPHEFRTTVVPGLHTARELRSIAELVHGGQCFVVQDFVSKNPARAEFRGRSAFPHKPLEDLRPYVEKRMGAYHIRHSDAAKPMPSLRRRVDAVKNCRS